MKRPVLVILAVWSVMCAAHGQGLLSIGPQIEREGTWPLTATLTSSVGWDSNPSAGSQGTTPSSSSQGSLDLQNEINLSYAAADRINQLNLTADYTNLWYADATPGSQNPSNNWTFGLNYTRQESRRLTLSDSLYLAHQTQPDFSVGLTINRPTTGSLVGSNSLSLTYALSRVWSAVSSYSLTDVHYDDATLQNEDYVENLFSEQLRYAASRRSTLTMDLRYEILSYSHNPDASSNSQFLLLGIDHQFSRWLQGTVSGGVEFRDYKGPLGNTTAPDLEASLNYRTGKYTTWRWYASLGLNDTGNAGNQSGYSYQTGLSFQQGLTARLTLSLSVNGEWTDFSGGQAGAENPIQQTPIGIPPNVTDNLQQSFSGSMNLNYAIWRNVSVKAGYTYSDVSASNGVVGAYQRQQVTLGLTATF